MTLDEIRTLEAAATAAPWTWLPDDRDQATGAWVRFGGEGALNESGYGIEEDVELLVAMRNALPALLDIAQAADGLQSAASGEKAWGPDGEHMATRYWREVREALARLGAS